MVRGGLRLTALLPPMSAACPVSAQHAEHIVVVLNRRLSAAEDPVEKVWVGAIKQRFEAIKLAAVKAGEADIGERPEEQVTFLCPAVPGSEK